MVLGRSSELPAAIFAATVSMENKFRSISLEEHLISDSLARIVQQFGAGTDFTVKRRMAESSLSCKIYW
jgi:hypothetical protein